MTVIASIITFLYSIFESPEYLAMIPVAALITVWLLGRKWIKIKEEPESARRKKVVRKLMFFMRSLLFTLLLVALASPFIIREQTISGEQYIKVLIDNSTSMSAFDLSQASKLISELEKRIHVDIITISSGDESRIGDGLLENLKKDESVLLVTDGRTTKGASLGDVALFAAKLNSSLNALNLDVTKHDSSISVSGPSKTVEGVDNTFTVHIFGTEKGERQVKVTLGSEVIYDKNTAETELTFTRKLSGGYHLIKAELPEKDLFAENNVWYKTVKVVEKPKVLLISKSNSPLKQFISPMYEVDEAASLPADLSKYYEVITNNMKADSILRADVDRLTNFVADGNGLIAFGGKESFDLGGYKGSAYEQLLPVFVSTPGKKEGNVNLVITVDISGSTGSGWGSNNVVDVEKALALGILQDLRAEDLVAVVAFNTQGHVVGELKYLFEHTELVSNVKKLQHNGGTLIESGLMTAADILKNAQGSKNIILISDGLTQVPANTENAAKIITNNGIRVYTVGVGPQTNEELMQNIASISNGIYFKAEDSSRIKILFGKPDQDKSNEFGVAILNSNHFITKGIDTKARVFGYNQVVPKTTAQMLVATSKGDPLITSWRFGLGRTAAISTDDGTSWAGQLLAKDNSKLLTRTINWAIGEPDRKADALVDVKDTRVNEPSEVIIRANQLPVNEGTVFHKTGDNLYFGLFTPAKQGFQQLLGATYGVNYVNEYNAMGIDAGLKNVVQSTGGKMFNADDVQGIVEQVKAHSTRTIMGRDVIRMPFIIAAIIIFLVELVVRRIWRKE